MNNTSNDLNNQKNRINKPKKFASPDALFSRFLQRRAKKPTEVQIHTWENDGGNIDVNDNSFTIINGRICCTFTERISAYFSKYWRLVRIQFHMRFLTHQSEQQPNS